MPFAPRSSRRGRSWFAELATARGPLTLATTGDNSFATMFGAAWAAEIRADDGRLLVYQYDTGTTEWGEVTSPDLPAVVGTVLPDDARRLTIAFDQAARIVLAYETDGTIKMTRWDASAGEYKQNVSFAGHDPALLMDATLREGRIPGSDVALFYVTPDRTGVRYRYQLESYGTEHELHDRPAGLMLDQVQPLAWRYQLLIASTNGDALADALVSELYPVFVEDALGVTAAPIGDGEYRLVKIARDESEELTLTAAAIEGGAYTEPTVARDESEELTLTAAAIASGEYREVVIPHDADAEELNLTAAAIQGGNYAQP